LHPSKHLMRFQEKLSTRIQGDATLAMEAAVKLRPTTKS
jgi:hypothetical protein